MNARWSRIGFPIGVAILVLLGLLGLNLPSNSQSSGSRPKRVMERLGRGVVAINQGDGKVFVSWRLLGTEPDDIAFNLYRKSGDGEAVRLNKQPLAKAT